MTFDYPRPLSFYHPEYAIGCGGCEIPTLWQGRTYLYVWHRSTRQHHWYCWESDLFSDTDLPPWQPH